MKIKLVLMFTFFAIFWQAAFSIQPDSTWSLPIRWGIYNIFPSPDGNYLFVNQYGRFAKIDSQTGQITDSIIGKGGIKAISPDWKYIYTCGTTFESIKKLDINTYQVVDSIDNMQDINNGDDIHKGPYKLTDLALAPNGKIILSVSYGKYLIILLDANTLEITDKIVTKDYNRGLDLIEVNGLSVSPKGDYFATNNIFAGYSGTPPQPTFDWEESWIWDLNTLKPKKQIYNDSVPINGARWSLTDFKFSPDGRYFGMVRADESGIFETNNFSLIKKMGISRVLSFDKKTLNLAANIGDKIHFYNLDDFYEICNQRALYTLTFELSQDGKYVYDFNNSTGFLTKSFSCIYNVNVKEQDTTRNPTIIFNSTINELQIKDINLEDNIYNYRIIGISGSIVASNKVNITNHQCNIPVNVLVTGVYFLSINNLTFKFSIVR